MLGRRESQGNFFRPDHAFRDHVGEETFYGLLARHGAEWFRDADFVALYREDFGRPSVPPSQLAVALLLQAHDSVSDGEAISRSAYDLRWKVALGLELGEKLCAKSTLQRFRAQLVLHEATGQIFERGIEACRAAGLLKRPTLSAAIDTTPVLGRGAMRDTYNLVSDGIRQVVDAACQLKSWERDEIVEAEGAELPFRRQLQWQPGPRLERCTGEAGRCRSARGRRTRHPRPRGACFAGICEGRRANAGASRGAAAVGRALGPGHRRGPGRRGWPLDSARNGEGPYRIDDRPGDAPRAQEPLEGHRGLQGRDRGGDRKRCHLGDRRASGQRARSRRGLPGTRKGMFDRRDFQADPKRGVARCPAGKRSIRSEAVAGDDPGLRYAFSRNDCSPCPLRERCTKSRLAARVLQITEKTEALWRLRRQQKTKRFRRRYRKRVVVAHRIGRIVQLGARQAKYFGKTKTAFQIALVATVANLMLVAAVTGAASFAALPLALLVGIASLAFSGLAAQNGPHKRAPSRPGF